MKRRTTWCVALVAVGLIVRWAAMASGSDGPGQARPPGRDAMDKAFAQGNFRDAYDGYRARVLDPKADPDGLAHDFARAVNCLERLGGVAEYDAFAEAALAAHPDAWRLWWE